MVYKWILLVYPVLLVDNSGSSWVLQADNTGFLIVVHHVWLIPGGSWFRMISEPTWPVKID